MNRSPLAAAALVLNVLGSGLALAGPLDPPPGPISPTNKTLAEVEPRTAINATNTPGDAESLYLITRPGSYYLTENVTGVAGKSGIKIADVVEGVTIDLMGFEMRGVPGSLHGIRADGHLSIVIRNGRFSYWGGDGVHVAGNSIVIEDLSVDSCQGWGVLQASNYPGNRISRVRAGQNALGGISASQLCLVERCTVYYSAPNPGISAASTSRVEGCEVWNCSPGVQLTGPAALVRDTTLYICPVGIAATSSDCVIERNVVRTTTGQVGLRATAAGNIFADNTVVGTGDKYDFVPGNRLRLTISQLPETIDWPAEVTLAGTLTGVSGQNGLTIASDDVTVDLGGHALVGVAGSLDGIAVSGFRRNITVRNGILQSWAGDGVDVSGAISGTVENVEASDNTGSGIRTGERAAVRKCVTRQNGSDNIVVGGYSQVIDCLADASTGGHGINASFTQSLVRGCTASGNFISGIRASQRTAVQGCVCSNNTQNGVHITFAGSVEDCFINANAGDGIFMDAGGAVTIRNNTVSESSGVGDAGIRVINAGLCHLEGNHVTLCATGIHVASSPNTVIRNSSMSSTANYNIVAGNTAGPVVTPATAGAATNPLANLSN